MGLETFPVFEDGVAGDFLRSAEWKDLTRAVELLENTARDLEVTPLSDFNSTLPEDFSEGEELEEIRAEILACDGVFPTRKWFTAEDGLVAVKALLDYSRRQPEEFWKRDAGLSDRESSIEILEELEHALKTADERGARFYLRSVF